MRHPKRHLREFLDAELPHRKQAAVQAHLEHCATCRCLVEEERRLRSRLRAMNIPAPGEDLARRIVAGPGSATVPPEPAAPSRPGRYVLAFGSVLTLVSGFVLAGAYVLGTLADEPLTAPQQAHLLAGWNDIAEEPEDELSSEELAELRNSGWSCPELAELGFTVESARTETVAGHPAVALVLVRGEEKILLYEQRPWQGGKNNEVLHAVSGRPVAEAGFTAQEGTPTAPRIWQAPSRPGEAVLSTGNVTYTLASSAPAETMTGAVSELSLSESARLLVPASDGEDTAVQRILRGLSVLAGAGGSL